MYAISDVKKVSLSGIMSVTTNDAGTTFDLTWSEIPGAMQYRVYCVGSYSSSITDIGSYSFTSYENSTSYMYDDVYGYLYVFFFAVGIDGLGQEVGTTTIYREKVLKSPVLSDVTLSSYSSYNGYTYTLSWYSSEPYSSDKNYCIFHDQDAYGTTTSEETVKGYFENNPYSYQTDSVSFGITTYDVSFSDTTIVHYYAVGTRAYDNDSRSYVYAISDVKKVSWSGEISVNTDDLGNTFTLSWSEIPGATQYRVYCIGSYSSSITNIGSYSPATYTNSTSYTYDNGDNYSYVFFFVVGVDDDGQEVGNTTVYRWS